MKNIIFVDTETTGLYETKDYIWQLAWIEGVQTDNKLKLLDGKEILLLPKGKKHPKRLKTFTKSLEKADMVVGHNVMFAYYFLSDYGIEIRQEKFCTMKASTGLCCIPHFFYGYKWPRLSEAVRILLKEEPEYKKLHDARYDVFLTARLYAYINSLEVDTESLKWHQSSNLLRFIYGFIFSPIDPYLSMREETKEKIKHLASLMKPLPHMKLNLKHFKLWQRKENKEIEEDIPF
ncbi:MAG: 3'-5' exonuclease [Nitrososphaeria archaeon]